MCVEKDLIHRLGLLVCPKIVQLCERTNIPSTIRGMSREDLIRGISNPFYHVHHVGSIPPIRVLNLIMDWQLSLPHQFRFVYDGGDILHLSIGKVEGQGACIFSDLLFITRADQYT